MDRLSKTLQQARDREQREEEVRRANRPEWTTPQMTILKEIKTELVKLRLVGVGIGVLLVVAIGVLLIR